VATENWTRASRLVRIAVATGVLALGLATAPLVMPVLPEAQLARYQDRFFSLLHIPRESTATEHQRQPELPDDFAGMHGWPELAATVANVYESLPPDERVQAVILAQNYCEAGAIEFLGRSARLPVISGHNQYFFGGTPRLQRQGTDLCGRQLLLNGSGLSELFGCRKLFRSLDPTLRTGYTRHDLPRNKQTALGALAGRQVLPLRNRQASYLISRRSKPKLQEIGAGLVGFGDLQGLVGLQAVGDHLFVPGGPIDLDTIDFLRVAQSKIERKHALRQVTGFTVVVAGVGLRARVHAHGRA
jgi:hypothetical protein